ncbi:MAG: hypothetical protein ACREIU_10895 [Planctomycetota bacterium]
MASKKILLEVLSTDRNRMGPAPPRPRKEKEERRREKPPRSSRPLSLPHPTAQSLLLVLAGVVAVVVSYGVGFWRGRAAPSTPPDLSTKAPALLDQVPDEPVPPKSIGGDARPAEPKQVRYGLQLVSYEPGERNAERARGVKKELEALGLPSVMAWQNEPPGPRTVFITVGSFPSKEDAGLEALRERVRTMPFGTEKAPFAGATIRTLPVQ